MSEKYVSVQILEHNAKALLELSKQIHKSNLEESSDDSLQIVNKVGENLTKLGVALEEGDEIEFENFTVSEDAEVEVDSWEDSQEDDSDDFEEEAFEEDEDDAEEDEKPVKSKSSKKSKKQIEEEDDEDLDDEDDAEEDEESEEDEEEEEDETPAKKSKSKTTAKAKPTKEVAKSKEKAFDKKVLKALQKVATAYEIKVSKKLKSDAEIALAIVDGGEEAGFIVKGKTLEAKADSLIQDVAAYENTYKVLNAMIKKEPKKLEKLYAKEGVKLPKDAKKIKHEDLISTLIEGKQYRAK